GGGRSCWVDAAGGEREAASQDHADRPQRSHTPVMPSQPFRHPPRTPESVLDTPDGWPKATAATRRESGARQDEEVLAVRHRIRDGPVPRDLEAGAGDQVKVRRAVEMAPEHGDTQPAVGVVIGG